MRKRFLTFVAALAIVIAGWSLRRSPAPAAAHSAAAPKVIARLVGREQTISIFATASGPRYTISTSVGRPLLVDLTLDELRRKDPTSYQQVTASHADSTPWAGIDLSD